MTEKEKWRSKHLHNGIISKDQDKYYDENLTLKEQIEIREYVADFHAINEKRLPEMQKTINTLKVRLSQSK